MKLNLRNILAYIFGSCIFFIAGPIAIFYISDLWFYEFMPVGLPSAIFGAISSGVGLFFVVWSNYELITKGHGGAVVVGSVKMSEETIKLVTSGPYALCRNPMHMGLILFYLGLCCAINSLITLVIPFSMLCFAYGFAVFLDEPRLKRDFPKDYEKWVHDVPQRFWPKLKKG